MTKPRAVMGRKYGTWFLMRRTHDIMVQARNRELRQYGINLEYSGTLNLVLKLGKDATPGEIARWRYRRPHTVSEVLRSMERDGLVRRDRDLLRRNVIRVKATARGRRVHRESRQTLAEIKQIFASLGREELERLFLFLERLRSRAITAFAVDYDAAPLKEQLVDGELEYNLWRVLRRVNDIIVRIREHELSQHGFSAETTAVLVAIDILGERATPGEIALVRQRSAGSISAFLTRLEDGGLVRKHRDLKKKNQVRAALTAKGERYLRQATRAASINYLFDIFTAQELTEIGALFTRLQERAVAHLGPRGRDRWKELVSTGKFDPVLTGSEVKTWTGRNST